MQDKLGYETCRSLKHNDDLVDLLLLFLTGLDSVEEKVDTFAAGGVDYIIEARNNLDNPEVRL